MSTQRSSASARRSSPISEGLREVIQSRGLSASGVAYEAGLNPAVVSRWLAGTRDLRLASADKIAAALGLKLTEAAARRRGRPRRAGRGGNSG